MSFNIRKKMLVALLAVILPSMAVTVLIAVYNQTAYYKSRKKVELTSAEMVKVSGSEHAIERALMPGNDYIITGDKRYVDEFRKESEEVDGLLNDLELALSTKGEKNAREVNEEKEILGEVRISWKNMKELSRRIFALPEPVGSAVAKGLMEEMDYKWGRPASNRLARWHDMEMNVFQEAVKGIGAAWMRSWFLIGAAFITFTAGGIFFASFYSKRFVRPIRELHNGADRIAGDDLDYRVKIRTGDEIEQLAGRFNIMGEKLKRSYSVLEEKVRERTKELKCEKDKLISVFNAMVDGVYIVNRDYDIEYVNPVLEKEFGPYSGRKCYEYFHDRTGVCPWCPSPEVLKGRTVRWEWHSQKNNRTYDLIDTPVRNPDGSVSKLEIFRDITEKRQAEEKLKARLNELERFRTATIGREFRMKELRDEIQTLKEKIEKSYKRG